MVWNRRQNNFNQNEKNHFSIKSKIICIRPVSESLLQKNCSLTLTANSHRPLKTDCSTSTYVTAVEPLTSSRLLKTSGLHMLGLLRHYMKAIICTITAGSCWSVDLWDWRWTKCQKVMKRDHGVPTRMSLKLKLISIHILSLYESTPQKGECQQGQGGQGTSESHDHTVRTQNVLHLCHFAITWWRLKLYWTYFMLQWERLFYKSKSMWSAERHKVLRPNRASVISVKACFSFLKL